MKDQQKPVIKPQPGPVDLTTCDLPKRLLAKLAQHDQMQTYLTDVCRRDRLPYVRLDGSTVQDLREWCERKLHVIPSPLTYRGRPVIRDHEPVPSYQLAPA